MHDSPHPPLEITIRTARDQACCLLDGLTRAYTEAESARRQSWSANGDRPDVGRARLRRAIDRTRELIGRLDRAAEGVDTADLAHSQMAIKIIAHDLDKLVRYV